MKLLHLFKLPVPWESKVPKHYKSNTLLGELHLTKKISSNFQKEVKMIIPPQSFEIPKKIVFLQVLFCEVNEKRSKNFK